MQELLFFTKKLLKILEFNIKTDSNKAYFVVDRKEYLSRLAWFIIFKQVDGRQNVRDELWF